MIDPNGDRGSRIVFYQRRRDGTLETLELRGRQQREERSMKGIHSGPELDPIDPDPDEGLFGRRRRIVPLLAVFAALLSFALTATTPAPAAAVTSGTATIQDGPDPIGGLSVVVACATSPALVPCLEAYTVHVKEHTTRYRHAPYTSDDERRTPTVRGKPGVVVDDGGPVLIVKL